MLDPGLLLVQGSEEVFLRIMVEVVLSLLKYHYIFLENMYTVHVLNDGPLKGLNYTTNVIIIHSYTETK